MPPNHQSPRFPNLLKQLLIPLLIVMGCGKDLTQILFHPSVDQRAYDSLSGALPGPTGVPLPDPEKFSFAVMADVQIKAENTNLLTRFKADVQANSIQFFVVLGDLTEDGTQDEFDKVKGDLKNVGIPYYITIGNHDLFQAGSAGGWPGWKSTFGPATYSVTLANAVRFIFLDTASADIGTQQFSWLRDQLSTQVPFTFVGGHYPIYDGMTPSMFRLSSVDERYDLMNLLNQSGVYAYIGGHVHGFRQNQVDNVLHFITGSMFPYDLDYGNHGYLLFTYDHGKMAWKQVTFPDVP